MTEDESIEDLPSAVVPEELQEDKKPALDPEQYWALVMAAVG